MTNKITGPSEEFVEKIIAESAHDPRAMIAAVWEAGVQSQRAKGTAALVGNFASSNAALLRKVERVRNVLRNTINKHYVATPAGFKWATSPERFILSGIERNNGTSYSQRWADITLDIAAGKTEFTDTDVIVLRGAGHYNSGLSFRFPAIWFTMSDGDIAKMVRAQVKDAAKAQKEADLKALMKRTEHLKKELAKAFAQIESKS